MLPLHPPIAWPCASPLDKSKQEMQSQIVQRSRLLQARTVITAQLGQTAAMNGTTTDYN